MLKVSVSLLHRGKRTSNPLIGRISKVAARPDNRAQAAVAHPTDFTATDCYNRYP
jgi:hypothetical protein